MLRIAMGASAERLQVNKIPANSQSGAQDRPPLRPRWLHPVSSASVVGIFVAFFASGIYWREPQVVDLNAISADLIPEGVSLEAGDPAPEGDSLEEPLPIETASLTVEGMDELISDASPPPLIMEPDAVQAPENKEKAEKKEKVEKPGKAEKNARERREAADDERRANEKARRYGLPGGTGQGSGTARAGGRFGLRGGRGDASAASQASCLAQVAASIRGRTPAVTSLGPGTVSVSFYINAGGGISGIAVSGGSPAHAALARRIVASSRGPSNCGRVFARQGITFQ
jgi:outer membrane biosynthesis protein TonB